VTSTPWLYDVTAVSTLDAPISWSVITYPDPLPPEPVEPDPEDRCICGEINARNCPVHQ
jgi:hypothetical protein